MKKISRIAIAGAALLLFSCKPSADEAGKYNDQIVNLQIRIQTAENKLVEDYQDGDASKMEPALKEFNDEVKLCIEELNKLEKFDGKEDFKKAAGNMFAVYKAVGETEYAEILKIFKEPDEEYSEEKHARVLELDSILNAKEEKAMKELRVFHDSFAKEYHLIIDKNQDVPAAK